MLGGVALQAVGAAGRGEADDAGQADLDAFALTGPLFAAGWCQTSQMLAMPVAEIGWPFD